MIWFLIKFVIGALIGEKPYACASGEINIL
jgi:hypothetical protein